ncbi:tetratricopeptide repeat-containing sensor histidine kinase [Tenacibaculum sp. TC6]|uniref:tetratricopeptide repeat-containing sensor histidine kinase n=1 Tax=Tenacibaculum sp. TC6 TaxID=3423223 RepID=UPI003D36D84F
MFRSPKNGYILILLCVLWSNKIQAQTFFKLDSLRKQGNYKEYRNELYHISEEVKKSKDEKDDLKLHIKFLEYYKQFEFNVDSINKYYNKGKELALSYNNEPYRLNFEYMWADHLVSQGQYAKALVIFQSLEKVLNEKEYTFIPNFYDAYARLFFFLKDYEDSLTMLKKEAEIFEERQQYENICAVYNNIGILYKAQNQKDSSLYYHQKSQEINLRLKDTLGVIMSYNNMGLTYYENNDLFNAEKFYRKAFNYAPGRVTKSLLNNYATLLLIRGNYKKAEEFLLAVKEKGENKELIKDALTQLVTLHKMQKNFKEAVKYQEELSLISEDLLDEIKIKEIKRLQVVHETEKKEQQIQLLQEKTEAQQTIIKKNKLIVTIVLIVLLLVVIMFIMYLRNKINLDKLNKLQLQQQLLRSQMNPHFIFNALSNIQTNILKSENEKAVKYLTKFSKLLRYNLENSNLDKVTFSKEIQSITDYLDLQKLRLDNTLDYTLLIDETIEQDFIQIPAMIIQPIIENAIEHGIEGVENPKITIEISEADEKLICIVKDNGVGYTTTLNKKNKNTTKKSHATKIIQERLRLLSKKIKQSLIFSIDDVKDVENGTVGTKVIITLPVFEED